MFKQLMFHLSPPYNHHSYRAGLVLGPLQKLPKCSTRKNCKESSWKCIDGKYDCAKCKKGFELKNGRCIRGGGETAITVDLPSVTAQVTLSGFTEATFNEAAQTAFKNAVRTAAAQAVGYSESFITVIIRRFSNRVSLGRRRQLLENDELLDVVFSTTFEGALVANSFAELQALTAQSEQGAITFIATLKNNIATVFPVQTFPGGAILVGEPVISTEVVEIEANFPVPAAPAAPTNVQNVGTDLIQWTGTWTAAAESRPLTYSTKCVNAGDPNGCFGTTRGVGQSGLTTLTGRVLGLTPGTAYDCFAISVLVGDNLAKCSAPVRYTTLTVPVPMNLKVAPVEGEPLQRKLSWTAPSGISVTGYTVTCTNTADSADRRIAEVADPLTEVVIGDGTVGSTNTLLTPAAVYSCVVKTLSGTSSSAASDQAFTNKPVCALSSDTGFNIATVSGDPEADGWFYVGDSNQLGTYAKQSSATRFGVYITSFTLTQSIINAASSIPVSNPGNTGASLGLGAFEVGDVIVGVGVKYFDTQEGSPTFVFGSINPDGTGVGLTPATNVDECAADPDSATCGATSAINLGDFSNSGVLYVDGRFYATYRIITSIDPPAVDCVGGNTGQSIGTTGCPFGNQFLNTIGEPQDFANPAFHMSLPMRGMAKKATDSNNIQSIQLLYNVNKLQLDTQNGITDIAVRDFTSGWKFKFSHMNTLNDFVDTVGMGQLVCSDR